MSRTHSSKFKIEYVWVFEVYKTKYLHATNFDIILHLQENN